MNAKRKPKPDKVELFKEFVAEMGGEVLVPTNEYEVVRFRGYGRTSIIYRKMSGAWTFTGDAYAAWQAFDKNEVYRLADKTQRVNGVRMAPVDKAIRERDGDRCFYCEEQFELEGERRRTREHLVAATAKGPNHISNLFHACSKCNRTVGHLSAPEKIRFRDAQRAAPKVVGAP